VASQMGRQRRQRAGFIRQTRPHSPRPARFWHLVPSHAPRLRPPHCRNISTGCPGSNSWTAITRMDRAAGSTQALRSNAADTAPTIQLWRPAPHRQTSSPVFSTWRLGTNPPWCSDRTAMSPAIGGGRGTGEADPIAEHRGRSAEPVRTPPTERTVRGRHMPPPHLEALQEQADAVQRVLVEGLDAAEQEPLQALLAKLLGAARGQSD